MALIMKAREAADRVYEGVRKKVAERIGSGTHPLMATILVEGDPASAHYAYAKQRVAEKLGISFQLHTLPADMTEQALLQLVDRLNADPAVHGIMLELPLPKHLTAGKIEEAIAPNKDVDGVTPRNKLATVTGGAGLYPATPQACIKLLKHYGYELAGKNVTLIGRGQTVGLPLFHMLQRENATVTVCHSRTPDIASHLAHAEIAFTAVGRPDLVAREMVHAGLVIIDAGINELADGKITGDTSSDVSDYVAAISPVPGGVGTLTTAVLFDNLMKAIDIQLGEASEQ